jgi:uncharacterized protein (DUF2147 family)
MPSRRKKKRKTGYKPVQAPVKKQFPILWVSLLIVVAVVAVILVAANLWFTGQGQTSRADATASKAPASATSNNAGGFENLIGRWRRPDGGYIIAIRGIGADGRMDAAYLNPRSINVAQAKVSWKKNRQEVFIELRDTGYPGSTYTLDYNSSQDVLSGIYFQAALNQSFEVVFVREN